jgi:transposase
MRSTSLLALSIGRVDTHVEPFLAAVHRLTAFPGVGVSDLSAQVIRAEIGGDVSRFPTVGHLISSAGLSPPYPALAS